MYARSVNADGTLNFNKGIIADGVTSADVALAANLAFCTAHGLKLVLPPGQLLLTGAGATTSVLQSCGVEGAGIISGTSGSTPSMGTTILLTSTSVKPFTVGSNWSISGVNFYWPNQTGAISYPPLFSDDGANQSGDWWLDHVNIVNAYDGIVQTIGVGWGAYMMSNSWMYAVHDLFAFSSVGDMPHFSNMHFTPNTWLQICNFACEAAVNTAAQNNKLFHIINSAGGVYQLVIGTSNSFAWRYGFYLNGAGAVGASIVDIAWDGTGTLIDTSSGGVWRIQNKFTGSSASCSVPVYGGASTSTSPCFNLGSTSALRLDAFHNYGANGSFIITSGSSVYLKDVVIDGVGGIADGDDYYVLQLTGGSAEILVQNSRMTGIPSSTKVHGISTDSVAPLRLNIQGNTFLFFNDDVTAHTAASTIITGNWSAVTQGSSSVTLTGTDSVQYGANQWDKPPTATVSGCGTGATVVGGLSGTITVGSTNPTTACSLTLPLIPNGGSGGNCIFGSSVLVSGGPSGSPPTWALTFASDLHNGTVFFSCPGWQ